MLIDTLHYADNNWSSIKNEITDRSEADIVFVFGDSDTLKDAANYREIIELYPAARVVGASSSGNIMGPEIAGHSMVATAVKFERCSVAVSSVNISEDNDLERLSATLVNRLPQQDLKHVFVMSDGLNVNGSNLTRGLNQMQSVFSISGGMAGDGQRFQETWIVDQGRSLQNQIVAIGFYGDDLTVSTGCYAGWSSFGAERIVTRSEGNVLYELDGRPALDLYKEYLGDFAKDLPYSGMRFPLNIKADADSGEVIRTLLAIDEAAHSITFAGDIPEGYIARLMKPDLDVLIEGAEKAAQDIKQVAGKRGLALVVSCVGRRAVMQELSEEELEAISDTLGDNVHMTGFYSYGEIAPMQGDSMFCQLHNQTMTLTTLYE